VSDSFRQKKKILEVGHCVCVCVRQQYGRKGNEQQWCVSVYASVCVGHTSLMHEPVYIKKKHTQQTRSTRCCHAPSCTSHSPPSRESHDSVSSSIGLLLIPHTHRPSAPYRHQQAERGEPPKHQRDAPNHTLSSQRKHAGAYVRYRPSSTCTCVCVCVRV